MVIQVNGFDYKQINEAIRAADNECTVQGCLGQRFIGAGMTDKTINIEGIPGNALGAYLNGAEIKVYGNAQDAVGDTMNDGKITVCGSVGDAAGYAMRGGTILVRDNAGYRAGIHMKEYKEKIPKIIIGGYASSFLGEYQAGGVIVVLGLNTDGHRIIGDFSCTGMHGGKMFLRSDCSDIEFPSQVKTRKANDGDMAEILKYVREYCTAFDANEKAICDSVFTVVTPDNSNPYKRLYVAN